MFPSKAHFINFLISMILIINSKVYREILVTAFEFVSFANHVYGPVG